MNIIRVAIFSLFGFLLVGCAKRNHTHQPPAAPKMKEVLLVEALSQAIAALDSLYDRAAAMHERGGSQGVVNQTDTRQAERIHGLVPSEVEVVLQLAASDSKSIGGGLSVALPLVEGGTEWTSQVSRSNANTITVRLRSILFARTDELVGLKDLTRLLQAVRVLRDQRVGAPVN